MTSVFDRLVSPTSIASLKVHPSASRGLTSNTPALELKEYLIKSARYHALRLIGTLAEKLGLALPRNAVTLRVLTDNCASEDSQPMISTPLWCAPNPGIWTCEENYAKRSSMKKPQNSAVANASETSSPPQAWTSQIWTQVQSLNNALRIAAIRR